MTSLVWLARRETLRVSKLWTQTILAPVISSILFIVVFGLSLGGRIRGGVNGVEYDVFIVPGLITMAMVQAAYANNSASIFQARFDRYIHDVLSAPMRPWQMTLGYTIGGVFRALRTFPITSPSMSTSGLTSPCERRSCTNRNSTSSRARI